MNRTFIALAAAVLLSAPGAVLADEEEEVVDATPAPEELLHQLEGERSEIFEELTALEEGWSDFKKDDEEGPSEAEMKARMERLLERLSDLDDEIAALKTDKR